MPPVFSFLVIALLSLGSYVNTLGNGFVFDDRVVIQENQNLRSLSGLAGLWVTPYWSGEGRSNRLYRPVTMLSFALNYAAGGGAPWTFHLVNLLLHTLVCMTLMALLTRLFGWGFLPLAGAALFCVHPLLSEAVAGVVGRAEILSALFILSALLLDRFPAGSSRRRNAVFAGSAVLFFLAILAKENALAYPGLVLLTDQLMGRPEGTQRRLRVTELVILVAIAGVYLLLRARVLGVLMEPGAIPPIDNPLAHVPATRRVVTALFLTCRYLGLFVFPAKLSADYSAPQIVPVNGVSDPGAVLGVAVIATLAFLGWSLRRRLPPMAWSLAFTGCAFCLVSNVPFPVGTIFAERLFYLPSAGLCAAFGLLAGVVAQRRPRSSAAVLFLLVACLGARTRERNRDWKDDYTLFRSAVKVCPRSAKVRYNLANAYRRRGDLARAADNYRRCLALYDDFEPARRNLAVTLTDLGQGGEAVALLQSALLKAPGSASLHNNLGNAYRALGRIEEAEASYRRAASLDPRSPDPHNNLAALYQARGEMERAEAELLEALRLSPPSLRILSSLGDLYLQRREMGKALEAFEEAVHVDGASPVARRGLGEALLGLGRRGQAESELHRSLELDPSQWEAPALLGYLRQQQGEGEQAERYYLMSLAARPDQPELHQNLGVIYAGRPGGKAMALEHFRRCLELRPPEPTASRVKRMIEDLESGKLEGH